MAWLGYTVTLGSNKASDKVNFIRYDDWKMVDGLLLPNSISWYKVENGTPTTLRNKVSFVQVKVTEIPTPKAIFVKLEQAKYVHFLKKTLRCLHITTKDFSKNKSLFVDLDLKEMSNFVGIFFCWIKQYKKHNKNFTYSRIYRLCQKINLNKY